MNTRSWTGSAVLLATLVLTAGSLVAWKRASARKADAAAARQPEPVESITLAVARGRRYRPTTTSVGTVLALTSITLRNELAGTVRQVALVPERLLLFVQLAEPDERWAVSMKIDGRPVELWKAYSSTRRVARDFVGFWTDISALSADQPHTLELQLPTLKEGQLQGVFLENVELRRR